MPYSGQAASAFTQGLQQGYGFVDQAKTNNQNRELKAQEADQKAKLFEAQMNNEKLRQEGVGYQNEGLKQLSDQQKQLDSKIKGLSKQTFNNSLNDFVGAQGGEDTAAAFERFKKNEASIIAEQGGDVNSMRLPNGKTVEDRRLAVRGLINDGVDLTGYTPDEVNEIADIVGASGVYVVMGNDVVNADNFSVASGAATTKTKDQQDGYDTKEAKITSTFERINKAVETRRIEEEAARDAEVKVLKKKYSEGAAQLAGKAQLPGSTKSNATIATMLKEWQDKTPNATDEELLKYSMSLRGDNGSDSLSVYEKRVRDAVKHKDMTMEEAISYVTEGAQGAVIDKKAGYTDEAVSLGTQIANSGNYKAGTSSNSRAIEMKARQSNKKLDKRAIEFSELTVNAKQAVDLAERVISNIDDDKTSYGITSSISQWAKENTPQEFANLVDKYTSGKLGDKEFVEKIGVMGELGVAIGSMVNSFYGGNPSEGERKIFEKAFDFSTWNNSETIKAKMKSLNDMVKKQYKNEGLVRIREGLTYSTTTNMRDVLRDSKPKEPVITYTTGTQKGKRYKVKYTDDKYTSSEEL